jgi:gamma-glutamylcysteine synthetase
MFNDLKSYYKLIRNEMQTFTEEYMIIDIEDDIQLFEIY